MSIYSPSRTLRKLPREKAFYFFTSIGNYTGKSADSLEEFTKEILDANVRSLEFHLYRGDFERWISDTLEDYELASKIRKLKAVKPLGMDLRDRLYLIVSKHFEDLANPATGLTTSTLSKPKTTTLTFPKTSPKESVETQTAD
jgi:hypothetical protein